MTDLTSVPLLGTSLLHTHLLAGAQRVGGIYHLDFGKAQISTDDKWKADAGGVALHSFLLATVMHLDEPGDPEDEEVLLLRVDNTCMLPRQAELIEVREFAMRQMLTGAETTIDVLTQQEMQRAGLECKILGTFYQTDLPNGQGYLDFGADLDNLYAASRYRVYKPSPAALSLIASYPQITEDEVARGETPDLLNIGFVRYSSTRRRARTYGEHLVPVQIRVGDFIEMKSAVFGMTRMGKSNTMKTLAVATFRHAKRIGQPIGQLLFDPQGEYANPNVQDDGTALADLGDGVQIYRFGANPTTNPRDAGTIPLQINFFDSGQIEAAQEIIGAVLAGVAGSANYVQNFINADLADPAPGPDGQVNFARRSRASRARFCFHAMLNRAGFDSLARYPLTVAIKGEIVDLATAEQVAVAKSGRGLGRVDSPSDAETFLDWLVEKKDATGATPAETRTIEEIKKWFADQSVEAVMSLYNPSGNNRGWRWLRQLRPFHSINAGADYAHSVYSDLAQGKIVIVDLSRGSEQVLQMLSERIINYILGRATEKFTRNETADRIQIVIEEAHRLFDRKAYDADSPNPYVRLAKEAAKYKIGLIYATQEVTAVHPSILANTSNWIVAHLNNTHEISTLSRYYDFKAFEHAILSAEDRGYVRLKTRSGKFIIPVQVAKFDRTMINEARAEVGMPPLLPTAESNGAIS